MGFSFFSFSSWDLLIFVTDIVDGIQPTVHPKCAHRSYLVVFCCVLVSHYNDVIMGAKASQITSLTIVYSTGYSGADQRQHQSCASLAFVRGIHRWSVLGPVTRKMFPFDDVIMSQFYALSFRITSLPMRQLYDCPRTPKNMGGCIPWIHNNWWYNHNTMMTSSNGNIFRVTSPLWGQFTGHRWIPRTKASDTEL